MPREPVPGGPWTAHEGLDYAVVMGPGDTTDTAPVHCVTGEMARMVADAMNATQAEVSVPRDLLLSVCETALSDSFALASEFAGTNSERAAYKTEREDIEALLKYAET